MRHKWLSFLICMLTIPMMHSWAEASSSSVTPLSFQTFGTIKIAAPHARGYLINNKSYTFYPPVTIESIGSTNPNTFIIHSGEVNITNASKSGKSDYVATFAGPITYTIVQKHAPMVRTISGSADKAKYEQNEGLLSLIGYIKAKVQDASAFSSPGIIQATSLNIHTGTNKSVEIYGTKFTDFLQFHPLLSDPKSLNQIKSTVSIKQFSKAVFNKSEEVRITGDPATIDIENGPMSLNGDILAISTVADLSPKHFNLDMNGKIVTSLDWKPSPTEEATMNGHCDELNYSEFANLIHLMGGIHVLEIEMNDKKEISRKISIQAEEMQIPTEGTKNLSVTGEPTSDRAELTAYSTGIGSSASKHPAENFTIANFDRLFSEGENEYKILGAGSNLNYSVDTLGTTAQVFSPIITAIIPAQGSSTEIHATGGVQFHYETPQEKDLKTGTLISTVLGVNGLTKSFDLLLSSRQKPVTDSILTLNGPSTLTLKLTGQKAPVSYTDKVDDRVVLNLTQNTIDWFSNSHTASLTFTPNPSSLGTSNKKR